jgi:hypothetical protein
MQWAKEELKKIYYRSIPVEIICGILFSFTILN